MQLIRIEALVERALFRLALLLCPREFRSQYREELAADFEAGERVAAAWNIAVTGVTMRFEAFWHDLRTAVRPLIATPLVTLAAIAAMALAISVNFVVASLVQSFLLQPLPYDHPQQLLFVQESNEGRSISYPDAQRLARATGSYADLALAESHQALLSGYGRPSLVDGAIVSPNYFAVLGSHQAAGHFFSDDVAGRSGVIISYSFWHEHYAGQGSALGRLLRLDRHPYQIIGVAPKGFADPTPYGFVNRSYWLAIDPNDPKAVANSNFNYNGIARVHPNLDARAIARELSAQLSAIARRNPNVDGNMCCVDVASMAVQIAGPVEPLLLLLYAFVSIVVLIAFANVANLNIARNATRTGDLNVRTALGASPARIASQRIIEAFLQSAAGCAAGVALAYVGLHYISTASAPYLPQLATLGASASLAVYACLLLALATSITGGLQLKPAARSDGGLRARKTLSRLVVAEVALATALVAGAGLVLHSFIVTMGVHLGFDPKNVYIATLNLPFDSSMTDAQKRSLVSRSFERLKSRAGAGDVAESLVIPLSCCSSTAVGTRAGARHVPTLYNVVTPEYFSTLRIPMLLGRTFADSDSLRAPCVAVVDETFARQFYRTVDAIGRVITPDLFPGRRDCTIVGIAKAVPQGYGRPLAPMLYMSFGQVPEFANFIVRMPDSAPSAATQIDRDLESAAPALPSPDVTSYAAFMQERLAEPFVSALIFTLLAIIALVLALTGIYALMAYAVARRTREFGIRRSVGATPANIVKMVLASAFSHGGVGVSIGIVLAAALAVPLRAVLYETSPGEPVVYLAVIVLILAFALAAALIPALRASRVQPSVALRHE